MYVRANCRALNVRISKNNQSLPRTPKIEKRCYESHSVRAYFCLKKKIKTTILPNVTRNNSLNVRTFKKKIPPDV